jgi:hypothetical protein
MDLRWRGDRDGDDGHGPIRDAGAGDARGVGKCRTRTEAEYRDLSTNVLLIVGTSRFDAELLEARSLAGSRWSKLLDAEAQVERDEAALASRPKTRPAEPGDDLLPDRTLRQRGAAYADETKARIAALADFRESAKNERRALDALRVDFKRGR